MSNDTVIACIMMFISLMLGAMVDVSNANSIVGTAIVFIGLFAITLIVVD